MADKYVVEHLLGAGAMGVVVTARHRQLGERVALKFLRAESTLNREIVSRFLREARAAARIKSEHIARIVDLGTMEGGAPFIAMEFLDGCDLQKLLAERGALPVAEAVDYVVQACAAMAEAHAAGIVHRDLKPSNLFLTMRADGSPLVKVLDFGVSKMHLAAEETPHLTHSNGILGSPVYISPEQARNARAVDGRADVWSLGVILHQLLTGQPPFRGETITEVLSAVLSAPAPRLTEARPDLPPELEAILLRCLEKDVSVRMGSVVELALALAPWATTDARALIARLARAAPHPVSSAPVSAFELAPTQAQGPALPSLGTWTRSRPGSPPPRVLIVASAMVALAALVGAVGIAVFRRSHLPDVAPAATGTAVAASGRPAAAPDAAPGEPSAAPATAAPLSASSDREPKKTPAGASAGPHGPEKRRTEEKPAASTPPPPAPPASSAPSLRQLFDDRR